MRTPSLLSTLLLVAGACGGGSGDSVDATGGGDSGIDAAPAPPRVIPGGGIGDGPIHGVANVYVIDDVSRQPVAGAAVTVGTVSGTTDATGLFVATGVTGKQTVLVTASSYRAEMWLGANGQNLTLDLQKAVPTPGSAKLTGTVDLTSFQPLVAPGDILVAAATYSQDDSASDAANNLAQGTDNVCAVGSAAINCTLSVVARAGHVAVGVAILDDNTHGTASSADDTLTLLGWAVTPGVVVVDGQDQTGLTWNVIAPADTIAEKGDFLTNLPPAGLPFVNGIIGLELGTDGVLQLPSFATPAFPTVQVPSLDLFTNATYRFTGIAQGTQPATTGTPSSVTIVHAQSGGTLVPGPWLDPPGVTGDINRGGGHWTAIPDATVQGLSIVAGNSAIINVTSFDGTTTATFPDSAGIPATGTLTVTETGILAPTIDVTSFGLDADREKITAEASAEVQFGD